MSKRSKLLGAVVGAAILIVTIVFLLGRQDPATVAQPVTPLKAETPTPAPSPEPVEKAKSESLSKEELLAAARKDFQFLTAKTLRDLPRLRDLRRLHAAQVHTTPPQIREAAVRLGEVALAVEKNPTLKPEALEFYQACALEADYPHSVRALCFNRALRLYAELHKSVWPFDREKIPASVIELAKRL